jgi:hypothetical protein
MGRGTSPAAQWRSSLCFVLASSVATGCAALIGLDAGEDVASADAAVEAAPSPAEFFPVGFLDAGVLIDELEAAAASTEAVSTAEASAPPSSTAAPSGTSTAPAAPGAPVTVVSVSTPAPMAAAPSPPTMLMPVAPSPGATPSMDAGPAPAHGNGNAGNGIDDGADKHDAAMGPS